MKSKKTLKKLIFSLALVLGLALGTAALCSFADTAMVDGITYTYQPVQDGYVTILTVSPNPTGGITRFQVN